MNFSMPNPEPDYPDPPRVHWMTLLLGVGVVNMLIRRYAPAVFDDLLESLVVDAWAFYLCLWIRRLDSDSLSPFCCDVFVIVELAFAGLSAIQHPSSQIHLVTNALGIASAMIGIATVYLIRRDLLKHYNQREDFNLLLDPVLTLFGSFFYFQYHLYEIAEQKMKERSAVTA